MRSLRSELVASELETRPARELRGLRCAVTGASSGIGYFVAERLAGLGARVELVARSRQRAALAARSIRDRVPGADLGVVLADLAELRTVGQAARVLAERPVDALVLNAGVLPWDRAPATRDGFEAAFGVNQLGHFALLAGVAPALAADAAVVFLGSVTADHVRLDPRDPMRRAPRGVRYARSKLAALMTARELDRRARAASLPLRSLAVHPGYATDALSPARPGIVAPATPAFRAAVRGFAQGKDRAADLIVRAIACGAGGEYWGPGGWLRLAGPPVLTRWPRPARDATACETLWATSEARTGVACFGVEGVG